MMRATSMALVLSLAAGVLRADYRVNYRQGVQAFERQEWSEAARLFRLSMAEKPRDEDLRIQVPGSGRIAYVPNTLLAISLMRQDDCRSAIPYVQAALDHGISSQHAANYHRQLIAGRDACTNQLVSATTEEATSDLGEAREIVERLERLMSRADLQPYLAAQPELGQRLKQVAESAQNADNLLEASARAGMVALLRDARQSARAAKEGAEALREDVASFLRSALSAAVSDAEAAIAAADRAADDLRRLRDDPQGRSIWSANPGLGERARRAEEQLEQTKASLRTAREGRDPGPIADLVEEADESSSQLQDLHAEARRLIAAAAARPRAEPEPAPTTPAPTAADRTDRLTEVPSPTAGEPGVVDSAEPPASTSGSPAAPEPSTEPRAVPARLREAAGAYFRGEYTAVLEALAEPDFPRARFTAQAHLFRAASRLALYRLGGEQEETLLTAARDDAARGLASDPNLVVDPQYFPPSVIELYAAER